MLIKEVRRLNYIPLRDPYIVQRCEGKNVLHIGPTDWPYTEKKLKKNSLLYAKIDDVCKRQVGVDFDKEGADFLNSKEYQRSSIIVADMNDGINIDFSPDVIVFGETMEHLMNQEVALSSLKKHMNKETDLIISVPNATYLMQFVYALWGTERQHPDHSAAFSYKVMQQLLAKNDLKIEEFLFTFLSARDNDLNWKGRITHAITRPLASLFPLLSANLLVRVRLE